MKKTAILIGLGLAIAAGGSVMAQNGKRAEKMFEKFDINGDGRITQAEVENFRDQRFAKMDVNSDGQVTLAEMQDAGRQRAADRMAKRFEKIDANGDGALTLDEIKSRRQRKGG